MMLQTNLHTQTHRHTGDCQTYQTSRSSSTVYDHKWPTGGGHFGTKVGFCHVKDAEHRASERAGDAEASPW